MRLGSVSILRQGYGGSAGRVITMNPMKWAERLYGFIRRWLVPVIAYLLVGAIVLYLLDAWSP
jgi:hypothetical protein